jgi:cell wall-associated NlpC family hydrolase
MHIYSAIVGFVFLWIPLLASGAFYQAKDTIYALPDDEMIFKNYLEAMRGHQHLPFDSIIMKTARFFIGTPYVGGTLEIEPEGLAVNLRELDCFTFVETVISLSRMLASGDTTWNRFCNELRMIRYRNGRINGYLDRLHYTSDWMFENAERGIVRSLNEKNVGAKPYYFNLSFMSTHPTSYKQLGNDSVLIRNMKNIERKISRRKSYAYIPPKDINVLGAQLNNGDVVGFLTTVKGLDISHVGIVCHTDSGTLAFIHASQTAGQVILNPETITEYVAQRKTCNGIILVRPLSPPAGLFSVLQMQNVAQRSDNSAWRSLQTKLYRKYDYRSRIPLRNRMAGRAYATD